MFKSGKCPIWRKRKVAGGCWGQERWHQVAILNRVVKVGLNEKVTFEWQWERGGRMSHKELTVNTKALRSKRVWWNQDRCELGLCQSKWEDGDTHFPAPYLLFSTTLLIFWHTVFIYFYVIFSFVYFIFLLTYSSRMWALCGQGLYSFYFTIIFPGAKSAFHVVEMQLSICWMNEKIRRNMATW